MNSTLLEGQIHPHFKHIMAIESRKNGKKAKRHEEDEKFRSTPRRTAVHPATHDRAPPIMDRGGPHGHPLVALSRPVLVLLERCVLVFIWPTECALDVPALGLLDLLCYSLPLAWFQIILFSHKLGPNYANLQ